MSDRDKIRELNDQFRTSFVGGEILVTSGVQALGAHAVQVILAAVRKFSEFSEDNDPHGEHDFGVIEHEGQRIFWKIDCYDLAMEYGSPNAADVAVTRRIMTVMRATEY